LTRGETAPDSPALEEYWPDIDGLAHQETVADESIALSAPKGSFFDYAVAHVITTNTLFCANFTWSFTRKAFHPRVSSLHGRVALGE
jgi:hypothetical protein